MKFYGRYLGVLCACSLLIALSGCKQPRDQPEAEIEQSAEAEPPPSPEDIAASRRPTEEAALLLLNRRLVAAVESAPNPFQANQLEDQAGERWCAALKHHRDFREWTGVVSTIRPGDGGTLNIQIKIGDELTFQESIKQDTEAFYKMKNLKEDTAVKISGTIDKDGYYCGVWADLGMTTLEVHLIEIAPID